MNFILKHKKLTGFIIVAILYIMSISFKTVSIYTSGILVLMIYIYMTRSALKNVGDCIYYLVLIAPILGIGLSNLAIHYKLVEDTFINEILLTSLGYGLVWILVVCFGEIKVVKMATLILAQVATAIYLASTFVLNFIPIDDLNAYFSTIENFELIKYVYGHDARKCAEIAIQFLTYPIIVSALLTYIIAEFRDISHTGGFINH